MPIYEYLCQDCNSKFQLLRPMSESDRDALCTNCGCSAKKIISSFAFFSKDSSGKIVDSSSSSCNGCAATNCATCNH